MFIAITFIAVATWVVTLILSSIEKRWRFFDARDKQWATINRIGNYPPAGWTTAAWQNAVVMPYNVWGNVIWEPDSATPDEMSYLQSGLDRIVSETTTANSVESVDRVFALLLELKGDGRSGDFIRRHRAGFP
jgi:hypothetical protein